MEIRPNDVKISYDIGIPTPVEVANQLEKSFSPDQARAIAEYVYQPIRELLRNMII